MFVQKTLFFFLGGPGGLKAAKTGRSQPEKKKQEKLGKQKKHLNFYVFRICLGPRPPQKSIKTKTPPNPHKLNKTTKT